MVAWSALASGVSGFNWASLAVPVAMAARGLTTGQTARAEIESASGTALSLLYNARVERERQSLIVAAGNEQETQVRRMSRMLQGRNRAAIGASGLKLEGQRMDLLKEDALQASLDALKIRENTKRELRASQQREKFDRFQAKQTMKQGKYNSRATLLSGAVDVAGMAYGAYSEDRL